MFYVMACDGGQYADLVSIMLTREILDNYHKLLKHLKGV